MSTLTDILIASPSEAEAIFADPGRHERWPCLQATDLDPLVIADLLVALAADEDAAALRAVDAPRLVCERDGGGIFHLPDALPTLLAKLGDEDLPEVAKRWAQGGELSFDRQFQISLGYPVDNYVQGVELKLRELRDFSRQALMVNKPLLLWM